MHHVYYSNHFMIGTNKRRAVISYENMSTELMEAFKEKYPHGYADYMGDIFKVVKPDGTFSMQFLWKFPMPSIL